MISQAQITNDDLCGFEAILVSHSDKTLVARFTPGEDYEILFTVSHKSHPTNITDTTGSLEDAINLYNKI